MKPTQATTINGAILLILGLLNYISSSAFLLFIGLIPMLLGGLFLLSARFIEQQKIISYGVVGCSLLLILLLFNPLFIHLQAHSYLSAIRIMTMIFSCIVLLIVFYKTYQNRNKIGSWKKH